MEARDKVISGIKKHLLANGVDFPFPTTHVLFHDQTEQTNGDRAQQREGWPAGKAKVPGSRGIASALREMAHSLGNGKANEHGKRFG